MSARTDRKSRKLVWYAVGVASIYVAIVSAIFAVSPERLAGTQLFVFAALANVLVTFSLIYFLFTENVPGRFHLVLPLIILGFFLAPFCWVYVSRKTDLA